MSIQAVPASSTSEDQRKNIKITNQKYIYDVRSYTRFLRALKSQRTQNYVPTIDFNQVILPPVAYLPRVGGVYPGKLLWSGINKIRSPVFCCKWLRDGVHLVSGSSNGEITLWNPLKMIQEVNFLAHECAIRAITTSFDGNWIITADHNGYIKYWQSNLNLVMTFSANPEPIRDISFAPSDQKFASCGDDGLIKIWDFETYKCEQTLQGHGTDVKCIDWNNYSRLIISGSKDCQQPIMLWDPRCSSPLCTIHIHKNAIMAIKWSPTGNMFATASKDKTVKVFDIRAMKELQTFRGHKKEVYNVAWHSISEKMISSGSGEGTLIHWHLGNDKEIGTIENAHDGVIWEMVWHPEGHLLASVSNDHSCKLWGRNDPQSLTIAKPEEASTEACRDISEMQDLVLNHEQNSLNENDENIKKKQIKYPKCKLQFQCYIKSTKFRPPKPKTVVLPIGKTTLSKRPSKEENENDENYIYDDSIPFKEPESPKYIDVYNEEELAGVEIVKFTKLPGMLNRMPQSVVDHINGIISNMPRRRSSSSPLDFEFDTKNYNSKEPESKKSSLNASLNIASDNSPYASPDTN